MLLLVPIIKMQIRNLSHVDPGALRRPEGTEDRASVVRTETEYIPKEYGAFYSKDSRISPCTLHRENTLLAQFLVKWNRN
jgi:hypothetical protein